MGSYFKYIGDKEQYNIRSAKKTPLHPHGILYSFVKDIPLWVEEEIDIGKFQGMQHKLKQIVLSDPIAHLGQDDEHDQGTDEPQGEREGNEKEDKNSDPKNSRKRKGG